MATSITFRVRYDGEEMEEQRMVMLLENCVSIPDFLTATGLAYAKTAEGSMIYAGRSSYVEEMFLQAGSIICGPRSIGPVSRKELLALPTNNGVAHQEARMLRCSSSLVNQFPRTIRRCQLKPVVRQFMNSQEDTTRDFVPPELDRERQEPSQGEAQLHSNVYHNAFKIVNRVLKKEYHDQRLRFEWRLPPNAAVPGRNSLGGAPSGKKPDVNLMIPNTNHKKGAAEAKCLWILHEGRTSRDMEAANLDRLDRPLLIKPEEDPKVDLVDVFNQGDDSHPITKSLGQIHGYSRRGNYSIALLTCDAFTWALVTDPENLEDPFLSEHFRSTDVGPSTHELIYYATKVLLGEEDAPTFPDAINVNQLPPIFPRNTRQLRPRSGSSSGPDASYPGASGSAMSGSNVKGAGSGVSSAVLGAGAGGIVVKRAGGEAAAIDDAGKGALGVIGAAVGVTERDGADSGADMMTDEGAAVYSADAGADTVVSAGAGGSVVISAGAGCNAINGADAGLEVLIGAGAGGNALIDADAGANTVVSSQGGGGAAISAGAGRDAVIGAGAGGELVTGAGAGGDALTGAGAGGNALTGAGAGGDALTSADAGGDAVINTGAGGDAEMSAGARGDAGIGADGGVEGVTGAGAGANAVFSAGAEVGTLISAGVRTVSSAGAGGGTIISAGAGGDMVIGADARADALTGSEEVGDLVISTGGGAGSVIKTGAGGNPTSAGARGDTAIGADWGVEEVTGAGAGGNAVLIAGAWVDTVIDAGAGGGTAISADATADALTGADAGYAALIGADVGSAGGCEAEGLRGCGHPSGGQQGGEVAPNMEIDHGGGTEYAERLHPAERSHGLEQGGLREDVWLTEFVTDGFAGAVFRGLFGGKAVAVKTLDMSRSTSRLGYLLNEATVLMELSPLWDVTVPRLLAYGPYTDSTYAVILSWIEGRPLMVHDKGLLRSAAEALRSVHRRGYLHGDVRLSNFIVDGQNKVSCIDFGFAQKSLDDQAFRKEERQLKACFGKE